MREWIFIVKPAMKMKDPFPVSRHYDDMLPSGRHTTTKVKFKLNIHPLPTDFPWTFCFIFSYSRKKKKKLGRKFQFRFGSMRERMTRRKGGEELYN